MISFIVSNKCTFCGGCAALCPVDAIDVKASEVSISENCVACSRCYDFCPISAIDKEEQ